MEIKTLVIYTFSFSNPDDVEILMNKSHQYALKGYEPLFPPSLFNDTVVQQWRKIVNNEKIYLGTYDTPEEAVKVRDKYIIDNGLNEYPLSGL